MNLNAIKRRKYKDGIVYAHVSMEAKRFLEARCVELDVSISEFIDQVLTQLKEKLHANSQKRFA